MSKRIEKKEKCRMRTPPRSNGKGMTLSRICYCCINFKLTLITIVVVAALNRLNKQLNTNNWNWTKFVNCDVRKKKTYI